jgi:NAD(P)-dependent dehydrogenase (short-subunit alcohol dehydrogenase family)
MQQFHDKVAVITGAGRGIGRGIARRCAREGMKVVLAGIGHESLARTEAELRNEGVTVLCVQTDVTKAADVNRLAEKTLDAFGAVHLLVNNAGAGAGTTIWESTLADWAWTLGVNLWGVIYGVKVFTPIMVAQETECHIVNVASAAGLSAGPGLGIYKVAKHGVVSLSETLYYELAQRGTQVGVSVLCPGYVKTDIMTGERNRPAELQNDAIVS